MTLHLNNIKVNTEPYLLLNPLDVLVLMRICCQGGSTRPTLIDDIKPFIPQKLFSFNLKSEIDFSTQRLFELAHIKKSRGLFLATKSGIQNSENFLEMSFAKAPIWRDIRDIAIIRKAFGLAENFNTCKELLGDPFFLCALILQKKYNLKFSPSISKEELCLQLATFSLEKAFGAKSKYIIKKKFRLPPKLALLFAGTLSDSGREFSSCKSLFISLAAEAVGALKPSVGAIKSSLTVHFINELFRNYDPQNNKSILYPINKSPDVHLLKKTIPEFSKKKFSCDVNAPPTLEDVVVAVRNIARHSAQGWPGSRKIFISRIWDALSKDRNFLMISEQDFKRMLAEAHRRGDLLLSNADLKSEDLHHDIERSATPDRNSIWHYVRVED